MARKSYQQGFVKKVRRSYGIAYMLYWRERRADGSWKQRTKTLRNSCKAATSCGISHAMRGWISPL